MAPAHELLSNKNLLFLSSELFEKCWGQQTKTRSGLTIRDLELCKNPYFSNFGTIRVGVSIKTRPEFIK
jgi:hypothetical protein